MAKFHIEVPDDGLDRGELGTADGSRLTFTGAFQPVSRASSSAGKRWSSLSVGEWLGLVAVGGTLMLAAIGIAVCLFLPAFDASESGTFKTSTPLLVNSSPVSDNEE